MIRWQSTGLSRFQGRYAYKPHWTPICVWVPEIHLKCHTTFEWGRMAWCSIPWRWPCRMRANSKKTGNEHHILRPAAHRTGCWCYSWTFGRRTWAYASGGTKKNFPSTVYSAVCWIIHVEVTSESSASLSNSSSLTWLRLLPSTVTTKFAYSPMVNVINKTIRRIEFIVRTRTMHLRIQGCVSHYVVTLCTPLTSSLGLWKFHFRLQQGSCERGVHNRADRWEFCSVVSSFESISDVEELWSWIENIHVPGVKDIRYQRSSAR